MLWLALNSFTYQIKLLMYRLRIRETKTNVVILP